MTTKSKIKIAIGGLIVAGVIGGAVYFSQPKIGADILTLQTTNLNNLISQVQTDLQASGKYKRIAPFTKNGITYEVNEYETPEHEYGFWVVLKKDVQVLELSATTSKKEYINKTLTKSVGYGPQASQYTWDWR